MRVAVVKRYQQIISLGLSYLSIGLVLLLFLLILGLYPAWGNLVLLGVSIVSSAFLVRAILIEVKSELFDLTNPTVFEEGLLAFQSPKSRNAVFFAFRLTPSIIETKTAMRTLTILLKIIPISTICSFEWVSQEECFVNFFIKLDKESFLTRIQELVESVSTNLTTLLNPRMVHILKGDELMTHFSLGMTGSITRVSVGIKNGVFIQSDVTKERRVFTGIGPSNEISVGKIFAHKSNSQQLRVILSLRREESNFTVFDSLVVVSNEPINSILSSIKPKHIVKIPAGKAIQFFGDILSRNPVIFTQKALDFSSTAKLIFNQIKSVQLSQETIIAQPEFIQFEEGTNPVTWKTLLAQLSSTLGLPCVKDAQILIDGVPMRFDAQVGKFLFFIISQNLEQQISWLVERMVTGLKSEEHSDIGFLITNPIQIRVLEDTVSRIASEMRIHVVSNKQELEEVLTEYRSRVITDQQLLTPVA